MDVNLKINKAAFNNAYIHTLQDYNTRYMIFYGGGGSGKSWYAVQRQIIKRMTHKGNTLVIRKVGNTIRDSIYSLYVNTLKKWGIYKYCKATTSRLYIELPNGSKIIFKGLDDQEKIKSIDDIDDIMIEEATELTMDDFTQLDLRLRSKDPYQQIVLMFNPVSKANWVYLRFFNKDTRSTENSVITHTTYKDNRFLPKQYRESIENLINVNPRYYKIYALGEFATLGKLIYENWEVKEFDHAEIKGLHCYGLDFGFVNDPTALAAMIIQPTRKILYIYDEIYETNLLNTDIADRIKYKGLAKTQGVADSAEPKSIAEIRREGVMRIKPSYKGKGSILYGIQRLQQYKIIIHPRCKNTIVEVQNYEWKKDKKTNEYINYPQDEYNHIMDAVRYGEQVADKTRRTLDVKKALKI